MGLWGPWDPALSCLNLPVALPLLPLLTWQPDEMLLNQLKSIYPPTKMSTSYFSSMLFEIQNNMKPCGLDLYEALALWPWVINLSTKWDKQYLFPRLPWGFHEFTYLRQVEKCLANNECYIIVVITNTIIFGIKVIKATVQSAFFSNQAASLILTWISALTTVTPCRFSEHAPLLPVHSLLYILFSLATRPLSTRLPPTHPSPQLSYQLLC